MNIAIIPARGGSKRIPRKNIKSFCGKPIISYAIKTAQASKIFDRIIVSTDDLKIAKIAKKYGAEVPFLRPKKLSSDYATTTQVIAQVLKNLEAESSNPRFVCCIYPTAPLMLVSDLTRGLKKIKTTKSQFVFSVTSFPYPVERSFELKKNKNLKMLFPNRVLKRSQDAKKIYHDAGQFYWGGKKAWLNNKTILVKKSSHVKLPRWRVQDIDTKEDWIRAELTYKILKK